MNSGKPEAGDKFHNFSLHQVHPDLILCHEILPLCVCASVFGKPSGQGVRASADVSGDLSCHGNTERGGSLGGVSTDLVGQNEHVSLSNDVTCFLWEMSATTSLREQLGGRCYSQGSCLVEGTKQRMGKDDNDGMMAERLRSLYLDQMSWSYCVRWSGLLYLQWFHYSEFSSSLPFALTSLSNSLVNCCIHAALCLFVFAYTGENVPSCSLLLFASMICVNFCRTLRCGLEMTEIMVLKVKCTNSYDTSLWH